MIVLAPSSVQEMADLTVKGFDLADKYRMTSMILADGTMGQMMEPVSLNYGEQKKYDKSWAVTGTQMKREHNIINSLSLVPEELEKFNFARYEKYAKVEKNEVMYETYMTDDAEICIVAFGIAARVAKNAVVEARKMGIKAGLFRPITLWPFPKKQLDALADKVNAFVSVELSMGQMVEDIELSIHSKKPVHLVNRAGGMIPSPEQVIEKIVELNGGAK